MRRFSVLLPALLAILVGASPALAWTWPVDGPVLQPFSLGDDPYAAGHHRGIDIAAPFGTPVAAPASGLVTFAGTVPGGGKTVTIKTGDGYAVTLVHLGSIVTRGGDSVAEGAVIGTVGPSGDAEHAEPYVHLGIRVLSEAEGYVDPLTFLPVREAVAPPESSTEESAPPHAPADEPVPPESPAESPSPTPTEDGDSVDEAPGEQPAEEPLTTDASAPVEAKPAAAAIHPAATTVLRPLHTTPRSRVRMAVSPRRRGHATSPLRVPRAAGADAPRPHVRIERTSASEPGATPERRRSVSQTSRRFTYVLAALGGAVALVVGGMVAGRRRSDSVPAPATEPHASAGFPVLELVPSDPCGGVGRRRRQSERGQHARRHASVARRARTVVPGRRG